MDHRSLQMMEDIVLESRNSKPNSIRKECQKKTAFPTSMEKSAKPAQSKVEPTPRSLKVEMQTLTLSEESKNKLYETIKFIHGPNFRLAEASEYEDQNTYLGKQYWLQRGNLVIKGVTNYSIKDTAPNTYDQITKDFAASKLETYNFHSRHCGEALVHAEGNMGKALELLFYHYYGIGKLPKKELGELDCNDLLRIRQEEKEVLESIYEEAFTEKIKNQIWTINLKLNYLIEDESKKETKKIKSKVPLKDICRLYLQGKCKYGIKCRFLHRQPDLEEKPKAKIDPHFMLEIRFPEGNKYPYEPPYFYFYKTDGLFTGINCLRIVRRLHNEALLLCENGEQCLFSVISLLENEDEIKLWLQTNKEYFIDQDEPLIFKSSETESNGPTHHKKGLSNIKHRNALNTEDIYKEDKKIKENFMTKQNSHQYLKMKEARRKLPAWKKINEILEVIHENQVIIISGETGCGKSTQVPQFILDDWIINISEESKAHVEIICTQPRRISAIGVAERVAAERDDRIGNVIGYQIRLENKISNKTRLTFCTTGILLQRLSSDPYLKNVTHVVVDEVHERSAESDFLLMLLKRLIKKRSDLKIILMSATLKSDIFSEYFGKVPTLDIPGRTFPVEQFFLEDILEVSDYVLEINSKYSRKVKGDYNDLLTVLHDQSPEALVTPKETILDENLTLPQVVGRYKDYTEKTQKNIYFMDHEKINLDLIENVLEWIVDGQHDYPNTGTILVFLPGIAEIMAMKEVLSANRIFAPKNQRFLIIPLHSTLTSEEQSLVFKKPKKNVRKVVLSTNIAETSVTIDDCVFVVDTGKMKETRFDFNQNMESLEMCWVSRANALQRMGRAGRVMAGVCIHLYSSFRFRYHFLAQPIPEILRISLEPLLLRLKILHKGQNVDLHESLDQLLEPPDKESISTAIERLQDVGAFDPESTLTPLGHHLATLPVDVRIGKLILFGAIFYCVDSALTIAACLSHKSPFVTPYDKKHEVNKKKKEYFTANSDQLTTLKVYKKWQEVSERGYQASLNFANENFLSLKTLQTIADVKHQLLDLLISIGFIPIDAKKRQMGQDKVIQLTGPELNANNENYSLLQGLLCAALYPNVVKVFTPEKSFQITRTGAVPRQPKPEELKLKTKKDGYVNIHPSSINFSIGYFSSPYLIFQEKIKTSRVFIREVTMVPILSLVLFSGYGIDIELHNGTFILSLGDGWIKFAVETHRVAQLLQYARIELVKLLEQKMEDPMLNLVNHSHGKKIIRTIVNVVSNG